MTGPLEPDPIDDEPVDDEPIDDESVDESVDGRRARRDRNRDAVVAAVIELFAEGDGFPTLQSIADRSGVSLRSVHRYFDDSDEVALAALVAYVARHEDTLTFPPPPPGTPLDVRIADWVEHHFEAFRVTAETTLAVSARARRSARVHAALEARRTWTIAQLRATFAPELAALDPRQEAVTVALVHGVTLVESWDNMTRRHAVDLELVRASWEHQLRELLRPQP